MTDKTFGWFYKAGIILVWPLVAVVLAVLFVIALIAVPCFIPFAKVSKKADGSLTLSFGD